MSWWVYPLVISGFFIVCCVGGVVLREAVVETLIDGKRGEADPEG